jgi:hypothetical protein
MISLEYPHESGRKTSMQLVAKPAKKIKEFFLYP